MSQVHSEIRKAVQVIEAARYRMGVAEFVYTFIDHWAYQQTGLYQGTGTYGYRIITYLECGHEKLSWY